jgi:hypothetical protein
VLVRLARLLLLSAARRPTTYTLLTADRRQPLSFSSSTPTSASSGCRFWAPCLADVIGEKINFCFFHSQKRRKKKKKKEKNACNVSPPALVGLHLRCSSARHTYTCADDCADA